MPEYGVFIKEQVDSLRDDFENSVYFIDGRSKGVRAYLLAVLALRKQFHFDVWHCHHAFSAFVAFIAILSVSPFGSRPKILVSLLNHPENEIKFSRFTFLKKSILKFVLDRVDATIVKCEVSPWAYRSTRFYLPNGVDTDNFNIIFCHSGTKNQSADSTKTINTYFCHDILLSCE